MKKSLILRILFAAYGLLMLWLLFFQRLCWVTYENYAEQLAGLWNIVPFRTVSGYFRDLGASDPAVLRHAIVNNGGNIATFIPLGFFLPATVSFCRRYGKTLLVSAGMIVCVELIQLFSLLGSCDIDDLILNLIGVSLGYAVYRVAKGKIKGYGATSKGKERGEWRS